MRIWKLVIYLICVPSWLHWHIRATWLQYAIIYDCASFSGTFSSAECSFFTTFCGSFQTMQSWQIWWSWHCTWCSAHWKVKQLFPMFGRWLNIAGLPAAKSLLRSMKALEWGLRMLPVEFSAFLHTWILKETKTTTQQALKAPLSSIRYNSTTNKHRRMFHYLLVR